LAFALLFISSLIILPYVYTFIVAAHALIAIFISHLINLKLSYLKAVQITVHLFAPLTLLTLLLKIVGLYPPVPLLTTATITLALIPILARIKHEKRAKRHSLKAR
jgi:phosphatidylserine synthase